MTDWTPPTEGERAQSGLPRGVTEDAALAARDAPVPDATDWAVISELVQHGGPHWQVYGPMILRHIKQQSGRLAGAQFNYSYVHRQHFGW